MKETLELIRYWQSLADRLDHALEDVAEVVAEISESGGRT